MLMSVFGYQRTFLAVAWNVRFRVKSGYEMKAFRTSAKASLFFGRNEANGIRCVYHGWKYDTDGNCIRSIGELSERV